MSEHTPEPWQRGEEHEFKVEIQERSAPYHVVCTAHGTGGFGGRFPDHRAMDDNARRIVACVNACAGLSTEALESGELAKALEILGSIQWIEHSTHEEGWTECPVCHEEGHDYVLPEGRYLPGKHADSCEMATALRRLGKLP